MRAYLEYPVLVWMNGRSITHRTTLYCCGMRLVGAVTVFDYLVRINGAVARTQYGYAVYVLVTGSLCSGRSTDAEDDPSHALVLPVIPLDGYVTFPVLLLLHPGGAVDLLVANSLYRTFRSAWTGSSVAHLVIALRARALAPARARTAGYTLRHRLPHTTFLACTVPTVGPLALYYGFAGDWAFPPLRHHHHWHHGRIPGILATTRPNLGGMVKNPLLDLLTTPTWYIATSTLTIPMVEPV